MADLAKHAFAQRNYHLAAEIFERFLRNNDTIRSRSTQSFNVRATGDIYFGYADALARTGRLREAFDVYSHLATQYGWSPAADRLKHLANALLDSFLAAAVNVTRRISVEQQDDLKTIISAVAVAAAVNVAAGVNVGSGGIGGIGGGGCNVVTPLCAQQTQSQISTSTAAAAAAAAAAASQVPVDPLACPICDDVLRFPVTAACGHTFCRQCCFGRTSCRVCGTKFPVSGCEQDVLVRRLVERWWSAELRAAELNDEARRCVDACRLDDALRCCNESLEQAPTRFGSLLLRSEVLYRLNHFQSSLADADNALKSRPTSHKGHFRRAMALSGVGRTEEAIIAHCVAVCVDKSSQGVSVSARNDVTRLLQRLLAPTMSCAMSAGPYSPYGPYSMMAASSRHNKRRSRFHSVARPVSLASSDCEEDSSSCGEEPASDNNFIARRRISHGHSMYACDGSAAAAAAAAVAVSGASIPRQNVRLRSLLDRIQQEVQKIRRVDPIANLLQVSAPLVEASDFDCVLCCRTFWRPVVTPCGHTYCWVCLDRCMDYSSACPLCMAPLVEPFTGGRSVSGAGLSLAGSPALHNGGSNVTGGTVTPPALMSMSQRSVTRFLEHAMHRFIPNVFAKRQRQELEREPSVPIFICTTAFPSVPCPLFVYEPRYRLMVRRAIESGDREFGIVQPIGTLSGRQMIEQYSDSGTMLDIRDCVVLNDGCSILSTVGGRRFRVVARGEQDGYDAAKVEYIQDDAIVDTRLSAVIDLHERVFHKARDWYENLPATYKQEILRSFGRMPALENDWERVADGPSWAWWIIAILPLSQLLKVSILATTSLEKRLRAIDKTLRYVDAQKRRALCVVTCEGFPTCQATDCCQRANASSIDVLHDHTGSPTTEFQL